MRLRLIGWLVVAALTPPGPAAAQTAPGAHVFFSGTILIDPSSREGMHTFLRSYLRFDVFKKEKADLSLQAGVVPTPFGAYSPRAYSDKNPLVSDPLMYHYFTTLRSNQLPANNADLLRHRGRPRGRSWGRGSD